MTQTQKQARVGSREWTDVDQLKAILHKRWVGGQYLRQYAAAAQWTPVTIPVRGPTAAEVLDRFEEARQWVADFERKSHSAGGTEWFATEYRTVRGRNLGANAIPARIRIDRFEQLCAFLGTAREVQALDQLMEQTRTQVPELLPWVAQHPLVALGRREIWGALLAVVTWISTNDTEGLYLRQIDVEGVDTKFVEQNQKLLNELLTAALPPERVDSQYGYTDFTRRFGFLPKPGYTRFRVLDPSASAFTASLSELMLRTDELVDIEPDVSTVFIVENEITYLAFPKVKDAIVVFGSGFGLTRLTDLPWLHRKHIVYWGDIDTHGFDILDRLRALFGSVRSMLMDHQTLLAHSRQWVTEPSPTNRSLTHLTQEEGTLYRDLIEARYGVQVRLEQERVRFSLLRQALESRRS